MPETPTDQPCHCHLCEPDGETAGNAEVIGGHARDYGWHVQGVLDEGETPGWAYTVGLWHSYRSPEIAILGFLAADAMKMINILGGMVRDGATFEAEQKLPGVFHGYDVVLRDVTSDWYPVLFGQAIGFYRRPPLPFLQVSWPDREGRFVWDDGVSEGFRANQPHLWRSPTDQPTGPWEKLPGRFN